jgi:hypothetical protein
MRWGGMAMVYYPIVFNMPENASEIPVKNGKQQQPYMIHRLLWGR